MRRQQRENDWPEHDTRQGTATAQEPSPPARDGNAWTEHRGRPSDPSRRMAGGGAAADATRPPALRCGSGPPLGEVGWR